jgi:hypothetical protein
MNVHWRKSTNESKGKAGTEIFSHSSNVPLVSSSLLLTLIVSVGSSSSEFLLSSDTLQSACHALVLPKIFSSEKILFFSFKKLPVGSLGPLKGNLLFV